jgi:DNA-binding MarR family transcriptional regulator
MSPAAVVPLEIRPGTSMTGVLALMDELALLAGAGEEVRRQVEELTGLRSGELQALLAVADGADRPAAVAEATGQVHDAAAATIEALRRRGLVNRAPGAALRLTEYGQVVRQQAEGLRIRALHGVVSALGEQATAELRSTVQALGSVLSPEVRSASGTRSALPC